MASPLDFSVSPNVIQVGPGVQSILNVTCKFKNSYLLQENENRQSNSKCTRSAGHLFSHLLIGRIKDSSILFSFIV